MKRSAPLRRRTPLRARYRPSRAWAQARRETQARARGLCEVRAAGCDVRGSQAHHLLRRSQGGADDPSNLAWVCGSCHEHVHRNPAWAYGAGWLRRGVA